MAKIGNFGKLIVFSVSDEKVLTFSNFKKEVSSRWTLHSSIAGKQVPEYLGQAQDKISMTVVLSAMHGVKPRKVLSRIENAVRSGQVETLVIGKKIIGKYYISKLSETWDYVYKKGELFQVSLNLSLEEYT